MYSYLHNESSNTQYSYHARHIWFDGFSARHHGDVVIVRTYGVLNLQEPKPLQ